MPTTEENPAAMYRYILRLEADLTAALNIAEASARQCEKLRSACETALAIAEWREAGDFDTVMRLMRAALAPEEEKDG